MVDEKRQQFRKPYIMEVEYEVNGALYQDFILDISIGGLFIETMNDFAIGDNISIRFELQNIDKRLHLDGVIVWKGDHGYGVQFINLYEEQREIIDKFVMSIS